MAYLTKANCKEIILIEGYNSNKEENKTTTYIITGSVIGVLLIFFLIYLYNRKSK